MTDGMRQENIEFVEELRGNEEKIKFLRELKSLSPVTRDEAKEKISVGDVEQKIDYFLDKGLLDIEEEKLKVQEEIAANIIEYATSDWNPSNEGTKRAQTFEVLSDCEWHCANCELPGSQSAKNIQFFRKKGFEFVQKTGQGQGDMRYCENCDDTTFHRKLKHSFPTRKSITRKGMPESFKKRVRKLYNNRDAFDQSSSSTTLEVDHRKPEIRWDKPEDFEFENMTDEEIREHFQILSRKNNLLKSRKCEECVKTGKRPKFMGVDFHYKGENKYEDDVGCEGCGWYKPQKWRKALNKKINSG